MSSSWAEARGGSPNVHDPILDKFLAVNSLATFITFILLQIAVFRFVRRENVLNWLVYLFCAAAGVDIIISGCYLWQNQIIQFSSLIEILYIYILMLCIYGLVSFCYVLSIFGVHESSIRLRIIRELDEKGPEGISWEGLSQHYNAGMILKIRLGRLVASRDLIFDGEFYWLNNRHNVFSVIHSVGRLLKSVYKLP